MERIDRLETKVREMIAMVHSLREENGRLQAQVAEYETRMSGLSAEQGVIDEERSRLRDRIESMLSDLEALEASAAGPEAVDEPAPSGFGMDASPEPQPSADGPSDAGSVEISLPEPEADDDPQYGFTLEPATRNAPESDSETDDTDPPTPPGSDPAHPVLPGFS
ncbi:MAG: cell division protein ZapB [Nitrospirota bacterium]|nr:cell division protein ZapB [Nitrospirota bacterium]